MVHVKNAVLKDKLHLAPSTTKKDAQCLVGHLRLWNQHIPYFGILLWPIQYITTAAYECDPEQENTLQQAALHAEHMIQQI